MSVKRRTKMVCIRLLDDEYQQVREYCEAKGGVSVSDLVRDALLGMVRKTVFVPAVKNIEHRVEELDAQLLALQRRVERLGMRVESE